MSDTFTLEIATPEAMVFSGQVETVTAPATLGEFGVLAGHTDFLTTLRAGLLTYTESGTKKSLIVSRGYSEVTPEKTTILVSSAEDLADIGRGDADTKLKEAQEAVASLEGKVEEDADKAAEYEGALERLELAQARAEAIKDGKGGH